MKEISQSSIPVQKSFGNSEKSWAVGLENEFSPSKTLPGRSVKYTGEINEYK